VGHLADSVSQPGFFRHGRLAGDLEIDVDGYAKERDRQVDLDPHEAVATRRFLFDFSPGNRTGERGDVEQVVGAFRVFREAAAESDDDEPPVVELLSIGPSRMAEQPLSVASPRPVIPGGS